MKNFTDFIKIIIKYEKYYLLILAFDIIMNAITPFPYILLSKQIFNMVADGDSFHDFMKVILLMICLTVLFNFLYEILDTMTEVRGQQLMFKLNSLFNQKNIAIEYESLLNPKVLEKRELALKVISGSSFIDLIRNIKTIFSNIFIILGLLIIIIRIDFYLFIPVVIAILINTYVNSFVKRGEYNRTLEVVPYTRKADYMQNICSSFEYGKEIRINHCKHLIDKKINSLNIIVYEFIRKIITGQKLALKIGVFTNGMQELITYGILGYKVMITKIFTVGDFSMYFTTINQFKNSVISIISSIIDLKIKSLSIGHYLSFMEEKETQSGDILLQKKDFDDFVIEFVNVSFQYPGSAEYSLKNLNCKLHSKEKILIVGQNGAGKSTFVKLILRLYKPTEGKILFNGININDIKYENYVSGISTVFQDFRLFAFSLQENIVLEQSTEIEKIYNVLNQIDFDEKLKTLPDGIDTIVSKLYDERGTEFSGGECQKIAISRALYKDSSIVILDEPTSALDPLAEYEIYCKFNDLAKNKMAIFISHRLASSKFSDRIMVFEHGKIVEEGTHEELIKIRGIYENMYMKQSQFYKDDFDGNLE